MARTDTLGNFLTDVATAIRTKKGTTDTIVASDFDTEIANLPSGDSSDAMITFSNYNGRGFPSKATINKFYNNSYKNISHSLMYNSSSYGGDGNSYYYNITDVVIPNDTIIIEQSAFYNLNNLKNINLPNTITKIGTNAFANCKNLLLTKLPPGIEIIGSSAFSSCNGITITEIPESVKELDISAFGYCNGITSLDIKTNAKIGLNCFLNCKNLNSITFSNETTVIDYYAFSGCSKLSSVVFPNTLTSIGNNSFADCSVLNITTIPDSVTTIGTYAFKNCTGLTEFTLPSNITMLNSGVFNGCSNLETVIINGNVTSISTQFLGSCTNLKKVVFNNITAVPSCHSNAFTSSGIVSGIGYIYVPDDLVDSIKVASGWSVYASAIKPISEIQI